MGRFYSELKNEISLEPGEEKTLIFLLGAVKKTDEKENLTSLIKKYQNEKNVSNELEKVKKMWDEMFSKLTVETPDKGFNFLINRWLKYQAISGRLWGRTAYYQTGEHMVLEISCKTAKYSYI